MVWAVVSKPGEITLQVWNKFISVSISNLGAIRNHIILGLEETLDVLTKKKPREGKEDIHHHHHTAPSHR
jgi:hypothetical protein